MLGKPRCTQLDLSSIEDILGFSERIREDAQVIVKGVGKCYSTVAFFAAAASEMKQIYDHGVYQTSA